MIAQQYNAIVSGLNPGYGAGQPHQYVPQPMSDEDRRVLPRRVSNSFLCVEDSNDVIAFNKVAKINLDTTALGWLENTA